MSESIMRCGLTAIVAAAVAICAVSAGAGGRAYAKQADRADKSTAAEPFDSAKVYFDRARQLGFPAAGAGPSYILRAEFTTRGSSGAVESGTYTDTWADDTHWRREATLGASRFVRSRKGKQRYRLEEGPDAAVLQFVLRAMEPLPATDSLQESSWMIRRDLIDGVATIRVARGIENPSGTPDGKDAEAYWFDETGQLVRTALNELQTQRSKFEDFNGILVARRIEIVLNGKIGLRMDVTALGPASDINARIFVIKKHAWMWPSPSEVR